MKRFFLYFSIIFILVFGAIIFWKYIYDYSEGYRAGLLQKVSNKGNIFKTYEGELILSSVESKTNVALASEKFLFSIDDEKVALQLEQLQGKYVVVHYHEKNGVLPWRGDTRYIVDSVRVNQ
jgi:hypothetical protein